MDQLRECLLVTFEEHPLAPVQTATHVKAMGVLRTLPGFTKIGEYWSTPDVSSQAKRQTWTEAAIEFSNLANDAREHDLHPGFVWELQKWASDCWAALGDLPRALDCFPIPSSGTKQSGAMSSRISLKMALGTALDSYDVMGLAGPKVTKFGRENVGLIHKFLDDRLASEPAREHHERFERWRAAADREPVPYFMINLAGGCRHPELKEHMFQYCQAAIEECAALIREAENALREDRDLPRVGEGWISETELYYAVTTTLAEYEVEAHARPKWLGRQHLDVFVPALALALEYQGRQHSVPVEYFGGQEAFEKSVRRDRNKQRKCTIAGVKLVHVHPGYDRQELLTWITQFATGSSTKGSGTGWRVVN